MRHLFFLALISALFGCSSLEKLSISRPPSATKVASLNLKNSGSFFHIRKENEKFFLTDPEDKKFFSIGLNSVSDSSIQQAIQILDAGNFNSLGAWSDYKAIEAQRPMPYTIMIGFMSEYAKKKLGRTPGRHGYPNDTIFIFDPEFESFCHDKAKALSPYRDDRYLIGYFSDNELPFLPDALDRYLILPEEDAGRIAAEKWLSNHAKQKNNISDQDRSEFLSLVASKYFQIVSSAIHSVDPNHLFLGSRFCTFKELENPILFRTAGAYADVISVNYYKTPIPDQNLMNKWSKWSGRPFLITEAYAKADDTNLPNEEGAGLRVKTQSDRAQFYRNFMQGLRRNKHCLGWHWFKYRDEVDRKTGTPISNKGVISATGQSYQELLQTMTVVNTEIYSSLKE